MESAIRLQDSWTYDGASLTSLFRTVEFNLQASRESIVSSYSIAHYDRYIAILEDPTAHGRQVFLEAHWTLMQTMLRLFNEKMEHLAQGEDPMPFTVQAAVDCSKYTLSLDTGGSVSVSSESRGPSYHMLPLPIATIESANHLPSWKSDEVAISGLIHPRTTALEGQARLPSGQLAFFKPSLDGKEAGFRRELTVLRRVSSSLGEPPEVHIPKLLGIVTSVDGTTILGLLTEWLDGSVFADTGESQRTDYRREWKAHCRAALQFLHRCHILWADINAHNILIANDHRAWIMDFDAGGLVGAELDPTEINKGRELAALDALLEG